jgi:hypothetical protein
MKGILGQLQKQRAKLVKQAEKRDEYQSKRSEDWQNSSTAVFYECKTGQIAEVIEHLDASIEELESFLNND